MQAVGGVQRGLGLVQDGEDPSLGGGRHQRGGGRQGARGRQLTHQGRHQPGVGQGQGGAPPQARGKWGAGRKAVLWQQICGAKEI